jgi:hypothetical protein
VSAKSHIKDLNSIKAQLQGSYPECVPLKRLITKLDLAIGSLQRWAR